MAEGIARDLTFGELLLARSVFGYSIRYYSVTIHCDSYLPFGSRKSNTVMTPNGEIWYRENLYSKDFSGDGVQAQHLFIHEMAHVWQRQHGMWVRTRGLVSWAAEYHYTLDGNKKLEIYPMEQQACIIADHWLLSRYGYNNWLYYLGLDVVKYRGGNNGNILSAYEAVLSEFFKGRYR